MPHVTERLYFEPGHALTFRARVVEAATHDGRPAVLLDRTSFYPTGGGQPNDTGRLDDARVIDVVEEVEGRILHVLDRASPADGREVDCEVDAVRRCDHMQQHTGQHILSAAFERLFDAETKGFRMGAGTSEIDVELEDPTGERICEAESLANSIVFSDLALKVHTVDREGATRLPLRKQSDRDGELRVIEIDGFDWSPCGGTHAQRTGEVGLIAIASVERAKRMARVSFACGGRALAEYRRANRTAVETARLFSTGRDDAPPLVGRLMEENKSLKRRVRELAEIASEVEGRRCFEAGEQRDGFRLVVCEFSDRPADEIRLLAHKIVASGPSVALLASNDGGVARFAFARSASDSVAGVDCGALLRAACDAVGGRGGGKPELAQGGGPDAGGIPAALDAARSMVK